MCDSCGCGQKNIPVTFKMPVNKAQIIYNEQKHTSEHVYNHQHEKVQEKNKHSHGKTISIEQDVLTVNNLLAESNRMFFEKNNIMALNLVSSPGSGGRDDQQWNADP